MMHVIWIRLPSVRGLHGESPRRPHRTQPLYHSMPVPFALTTEIAYGYNQLQRCFQLNFTYFTPLYPRGTSSAVRTRTDLISLAGHTECENMMKWPGTY